MRIGLRLGALVAAASLVPLGVVTAAVAGVAERAVTDAILRAETTTARASAAAVAARLDDVERLVRVQAGGYRLDTATDEARAAFVVATWRLMPPGTTVALLDASGEEVAPPVGAADPSDPSRLAAFRAARPASAPPGELVLGTPHVPVGATSAVVDLAVGSPRDDGFVLVAELPLAPLAEDLGTAVGAEREIALVDRDGRVLAHAGMPGLLEPARLRGALGSALADFRYESAAGVSVLAASAEVPNRPWVVVVAEPAAAVGVTSSAIRDRAVYIGAVAMLFAVGAGVLVAGTITRPVRRLVAAARALGGGDFGRRVPPHGTGELDELGVAFNRMAEALGREASLVQAGQVRAVGELGAGLAHALNNPLAGVLGALQLVRTRDASPDPLLVAAEAEAQRCREILVDMLRTSTVPVHGTPRDEDLVRVVDEAVGLVRAALAARRVRVDWTPAADPSPVRIDGPRVVHALVQFLAAAGGLAGPDGVLHVEVVTDGDAGRVRVGMPAADVPEDRMRAGGLAVWGARAALADAGGLFLPGGPPTTWDVRFGEVA